MKTVCININDCQQKRTNNLVIILHDELSPDARQDELDDILQAEGVEKVLKNMGYKTIKLSFSLKNVNSLPQKIKAINPLFVFNLVETVDRKSYLCYLACELLDSLGVRYTGSGPEAMFTSTNKILAKRLLSYFGLNTPEWVCSNGEGKFIDGEKYLVKPVSEEGSVGIYDSSLISLASKESMVEKVRLESERMGSECFAERYIEGREINVSILGSHIDPIILPPSEILFVGYEERGLVRIVNYDAKWTPESYNYKHTIRAFPCFKGDIELLNKLREMTHKCWEYFRLKDYARIDFRVDVEGTPWIIDINANPCITSGSGFVATAENAGYSYEDIIATIVGDSSSQNSLPLYGSN